MNKKIIYLIAFIALFSMVFVSCKDDIEPVEEELKLGRVLGPINVVARIRNQTTIELNWTPREGVEQYVVEFSESEDFSTIAHTATITAKDLPYQKGLVGETLYYVRVKAVSSNEAADSKWVVTSIETASENIFLPVQDEEIETTTAVVRWPENSDVTHLVISPGDIQRVITEEEKADGAALVDGLTGSTNYTVVLKKENKTRGTAFFTTLIDITNATVVNPEDNLKTIIEAAQPGDVIALLPGDYQAYTGLIVLSKPVLIVGRYPYNKPKLHVQFNITGAGNIELRDLDIDGNGTMQDVIRYNTASVEYGSLSINKCLIHDFTRSFVAANVSTAKVTSITIDNCVMTDIISSGGDFIDFRTTYVGNISITNSTFDNCAPARDFIRIDNVLPASNGYSGTGLISNVVVDHCTIYRPSTDMAGNRRVLYVRFDQNVISVKNTIIAESTGYYTNQPTTAQPAFQNNNYFNAPRFHDASIETISNLKVDNSSTYKTLDPQFEDAANGNFKVKNQTVIDNNIGDPRWLK